MATPLGERPVRQRPVRQRPVRQRPRQRPAGRWRRLTLAPGPLASSMARVWISDACLGWGVPRALRDTRLVITELVDNAVQHAGTAVEITAGVVNGRVHLRVRDGSTEQPVRRPVEPRGPGTPLDLRGLGLRRLDRYAADWGTVAHSDGKTVWATVPTS
jgi:anti-sigma regulatory factor (Ser/Thr protein kinase)